MRVLRCVCFSCGSGGSEHRSKACRVSRVPAPLASHRRHPPHCSARYPFCPQSPPNHTIRRPRGEGGDGRRRLPGGLPTPLPTYPPPHPLLATHPHLIRGYLYLSTHPRTGRAHHGRPEAIRSGRHAGLCPAGAHPGLPTSPTQYPPTAYPRCYMAVIPQRPTAERCALVRFLWLFRPKRVFSSPFSLSRLISRLPCHSPGPPRRPQPTQTNSSPPIRGYPYLSIHSSPSSPRRCSIRRTCTFPN